MSTTYDENDQYLHFSRYARQGLMEIRVNMTNCEKVLAGDFPLRIWAVTDIEAPDADGLPMDEEYQTLVDSEAELLGRINDNGATLYLGHILHQSQLVTVLHSRVQGSSISEGARRLGGSKRQWTVYTASDAEYRFVERKLMPQRAELRRMSDLEVLNALQAANDNPVVPRLLTFYGLFPQQGLAEQAAAVLNENDFTASPPSQIPGTGEYSWSLMFSCMATTEPDVIEQISNLADDICAHYQGKYDGWSADPVTS
ncbi:MAG: DUF695 domain-containing protein [Candidatus Sumerlaeia bacterium]|nr:DUF695 domain-containing protein [Candidatus Sumerlaeia bacterium]